MKLYYFNPTSDMEIANNTSSYCVPKFFRTFGSDLSCLPLLLASDQDALLVSKPPSVQFIEETLQWRKQSMPLFISREELIEKQLDIEQIIPWGWSPATEYFLAPLAEQCHKKPIWKPIWRDLSSRMYALSILEKMQQVGIQCRLDSTFNPVICSEVAAVQEQLTKHQQVVLKSPWSSAGRGVQMLRKSELNSSNIHWIQSILSTQKHLMVEALLQKTEDLSFHFFIHEDGSIESLGATQFFTNSNGQYQSTQLEQVDGTSRCSNRKDLASVQQQLTAVLADSLYPKHYSGYLGIDALHYRNAAGDCCIQPVLEINMRYSMGLIALLLEKQIGRNSKGYFQIEHFESLAVRDQKLNELRRSHPIHLEDQHIHSGFIALTDAYQDALTVAYALISP